MQEVLSELFYGNLRPNEKQFVRDSEYGKVIKIVSDCEDKLTTFSTISRDTKLSARTVVRALEDMLRR